MTDISVQEVSKHFGSVRAVEDWAFEIPAGKITGFLSPTGRGRPPRCGRCSAWSHRPKDRCSSAVGGTRTCPPPHVR
jgi:hypothetical protein